MYNALERVHLRFCKFLLHVPASACNLACYGELGRYPVELRAKLSVIKYWYRLVTDWSISPLLSEAYQLSLSIPKSWCSEVKGILDNLGFSEVWLYPTRLVWASSVNQLSERLHDQYFQGWSSSLKCTTGKLSILCEIIFLSLLI